MGKTIYLKDNELDCLRRVCTEYIEMMTSGEETYDLVEETLREGLETAMNKLEEK